MFTNLVCVKNLTFEPERVENSTAYCTKLETRIDGPFFVGSASYRRKISLKKWQKQLLDELNGLLAETLVSCGFKTHLAEAVSPLSFVI